MEPVAFEIFFVYSMGTVALTLVFILMYAMEPEDRRYSSRAALLAWLWPVVLVGLVGYGIIKLIQYTPQFFRDAWGNNGTNTNN
jgi:hypothetical protein